MTLICLSLRTCFLLLCPVPVLRNKPSMIQQLLTYTSRFPGYAKYLRQIQRHCMLDCKKMYDISSFPPSFSCTMKKRPSLPLTVHRVAAQTHRKLPPRDISSANKANAPRMNLLSDIPISPTTTVFVRDITIPRIRPWS